MEEIQIVHLKTKTISLKIKDFEGEIDVEDILQVDINNIIGDLITFPVLFNRLSNIKALVEDLVDSVALELKILEAEKYVQYKLSLVYSEEIVNKSSGKGTGTMKKIYPSENKIEAHVTMDDEVKNKRRELIETKKQSRIIDGLYWSAKSKDKKLDAISAKMTPEEFEGEILEGTINSVLIRSQNNAIN